MRSRLRAIAALPLLAVASCGASADASADPAAQECESVDQAVLDAIAAGAQDGTGLALTEGAAYRSPDHEKVYLVAATFTATGVEDQVGVWATNSIDPASPGIMMSVDGMAQQFTVWPVAEDTDAAISPADPSVTAARDCL